MIIYRPIAPLTTGSTGFKAALVAMVLAAALGTTWQASDESSAAPDVPAQTAPHA